MTHPIKTGFTFLEMIIAISLIAVLVAALIPFVNRTLATSSAPMFELQKTLQLSTDMEAINQDYRANYTADLETLRTRINAKIYGSGNYTVVANKYVVFTDANGDGFWEESDDGSGTNNVLHVTISNAAGTHFTRLFVEQ